MKLYDNYGNCKVKRFHVFFQMLRCKMIAVLLFSLTIWSEPLTRFDEIFMVVIAVGTCSDTVNKSFKWADKEYSVDYIFS